MLKLTTNFHSNSHFYKSIDLLQKTADTLFDGQITKSVVEHFPFRLITKKQRKIYHVMIHVLVSRTIRDT